MNNPTPQTFRDRHGREWTIIVDVPLLRLVRDRLGFHLLDAVEKDPALLADPVRVIDVAYLACADQHQASEEEFGRSFDGEALDRASVALALAIADFLPSDRGKVVRLALGKAIEAQREMVASVAKQLAE